MEQMTASEIVSSDPTCAEPLLFEKPGGALVWRVTAFVREKDQLMLCDDDGRRMEFATESAVRRFCHEHLPSVPIASVAARRLRA